MKAALAAVLESAPIFGGRYSTCTAQYMSLQLCHIPGWLVTSVCMHEVCPVWRIHFPKKGQARRVRPYSARHLDPELGL
jgi:hypothetical protein